MKHGFPTAPRAPGLTEAGGGAVEDPAPQGSTYPEPSSVQTMGTTSGNFAARVCSGVFIVAIALWAGTVFAEEVTCGSLETGQAGPWDYNDPMSRVPTGDAPQTRIKLVENVHFQPIHQQLAMKDRNLLARDIIYTLRVFPNHARALMAVSRLEAISGGKLPHSGRLPWETADCFFERAIRFRPNDAQVYHVQGIHLHQRKRYAAALEAYKRAEALGLSSPQFWYNLGLLYVDMGDFDNASEYARRAYAGGASLPGLRKKLDAASR